MRPDGLHNYLSMKKSDSLLTAAVCVVCALAMWSCGTTATNKTADVDDTKWEVEAYAVVTCDSLDLYVPDSAAYGDVLPLRCTYAPSDTAKVNKLLALNDSLLAAGGYTYQWVKYGHTDAVDLAVMPCEPLLKEEVEVTEVNHIPDYGDNLQIAFRFKDAKSWEEVTAANVGRMIAISIGGRVFNMPRVNCPITQGGCSVTVPADSVAKLLLGVDLTKF